MTDQQQPDLDAVAMAILDANQADAAPDQRTPVNP
jgi:hypothetical protein